MNTSTTSTIRRLEEPHIPDPRCSIRGCGAYAPWVETVEWDTGNTKGISFSGLCDGHKVERVAVNAIAEKENEECRRWRESPARLAWVEVERLTARHSDALNNRNTTREERTRRYGEIAAALAVYDAAVKQEEGV